MQKYINQINQLKNPTFQTIRTLAGQSIAHLSIEKQDALYGSLDRGVSLLNSHELLCKYLWSYGNMHQAKLLTAFKKLPPDLLRNPFEVIDWGCGQAMATINLFDFLKQNGYENLVRKVTLIEPADEALKRAELHASAYKLGNIEIKTICSYFENITPDQITGENDWPQLHIFSNILDVVEIDLKHLSKLVDSSVVSDSYLLCVGPLNATNSRIDAFFRYFDEDLVEQLYAYESRNFKECNMRNINTCKIKIYKLEPRTDGHLIPIKYYPPVQYQAAYELDATGALRKSDLLTFNERLTHFEVAAPFDLGASVYDDVHPVLAVANNIITRGLPTKASPYIEQKMQEAFNMTSRSVTYGEFRYLAKEGVNIEGTDQLFNEILDKADKLSADDAQKLQMLLTPVAVARFQKMFVEAVITGRLPLNKEKWNILIEEEDVPFGALAVEDLKNLIENILLLSKDYRDIKLPEIDLTIISNEIFADSPLHLNYKVMAEPTVSALKRQYDLVITQAVLKSETKEIDAFSKFHSRNNCYFNIRTSVAVKTARVIYTSDKIEYRSLVEKDDRGNFKEHEETKSILTYFLQLFFRKEAFRPGQLPILDRALQSLPVIGLLPTGGGKSLTYQIAGLLQPGVTLVVDPLKSLMKDQYDGLISSGIDYADYINSSMTPPEKEDVQQKLEASQLLFCFISPERLTIAGFRNRLKNMHEHNVYFSYGVIDEVHCVSEWGHDFRFSYLHLGRNLYNFVKAKHGPISLLGLTATASFDVLADVERELSGGGAFILDADVIVRYENTNRLELQYKIEKVPYQFVPDLTYLKNNKLDPKLPKAIDIRYENKNSPSKPTFLISYFSKIPFLLKELQKPDNLRQITERFLQRLENTEVNDDTRIEVPEDFFSDKSYYDHAGIIFCPYVKKKSISVEKNFKILKEHGIHAVGSFSGQDDDKSSIATLENFRSNKLGLMVATKAFGMGIDKPNVRYTIHMNYSGSLEEFVQEAGRAGRDRKLALAVVLMSDYNLVRISNEFKLDRSLWYLKDRWFYENDLKTILNHCNITIPIRYIKYATPAQDIIRLKCNKDNYTFRKNKCNTTCPDCKDCNLNKIPIEFKDWMLEEELIENFKQRKFKYSRLWIEYYNPDYDSMIYFHNKSFKGDHIELEIMNRLLHETPLYADNRKIKKKGLLSFLESINDHSFIEVIIPYITEEKKNKDNDKIQKLNEYDTSTNLVSDINKAIYRMCCIDLIDDFTQDYTNNCFNIRIKRNPPGGYYNGLKMFLLKYYSLDRVEKEIEIAHHYSQENDGDFLVKDEIKNCLEYLIRFIYEKLAIKKKKAIDEMRNFCNVGLSTSNWLEANELMKEHLFFYFNSKFARSNFHADNDEPFSLVDDTDNGKISSWEILFKYLRVIDDDIVGVGTPLDNVKHLYGAVRLISRSLTDSNPALALLDSFCLAYMGTKNNPTLENQLHKNYTEGFLDAEERTQSPTDFWKCFDNFNDILSTHCRDSETLQELKEEVMLRVHGRKLNKITEKYINA